MRLPVRHFTPVSTLVFATVRHFTPTSHSSLAMAGTANQAPRWAGLHLPLVLSLSRKPREVLLSTLHCAGGQPVSLTGTSTPCLQMLHVPLCLRGQRLLASIHTKLILKSIESKASSCREQHFAVVSVGMYVYMCTAVLPQLWLTIPVSDFLCKVNGNAHTSQATCRSSWLRNLTHEPCKLNIYQGFHLVPLAELSCHLAKPNLLHSLLQPL